MQINKLRIRIISAILCVLLIVCAFGGCKLTTDEGDDAQPTDAPADATPEVAATPWPENAEADASSVIMRCNGNELTLYDFGQAAYSSQYLQYVMYGMMTPDEFCKSVAGELESLMLLYCAAQDSGAELTDSELAEIDATISEHVDQVIDRYLEDVGADVEDRKAEALKLFEADLAEDGLDFDYFIKLVTNNLRMHTLAENYYHTLSETVSVSDDEVRTYLDQRLETAAEESISDFVADLTGYYDGNSPYPVYIVDDCFSVNHIYMGFETTPVSEGTVEYDKTSRLEDEAEVEAKLAQTADYDAFMELETEYGEDPGMDNDAYREFGYVIHGDLVNDYFAGFVYAAMNLRYGEWHVPVDMGATEEPEADEEPELTFFSLQDGTRVVKVYTESGVHYIIVNKEYKRGPVEYTVGDEKWESWRTAASQDSVTDYFTKLDEEWRTKFNIETDMATIMIKYGPSDDDPANK